MTFRGASQIAHALRAQLLGVYCRESRGAGRGEIREENCRRNEKGVDELGISKKHNRMTVQQRSPPRQALMYRACEAVNLSK